MFVLCCMKPVEQNATLATRNLIEVSEIFKQVAP
jgi:hypothetical protein